MKVMGFFGSLQVVVMMFDKEFVDILLMDIVIREVCFDNVYFVMIFIGIDLYLDIFIYIFLLYLFGDVSFNVMGILNVILQFVLL